MLFMVIERFKDDDMVPIYRRVRDAGRSLPEGLKYLGATFEIVPVVPSKDTREVVAPHLDKA
jgi:hypothetical protein